jgi:subfamily B ATP-binding cassette protein MsbA
MYLCAAVKDLKEIIKYTFLYKGTAALVVVCNLLFVVFNLLSLVLFIPILQLIFSNPDTAVRPIPAPTMESLLDVGYLQKKIYE